MLLARAGHNVLVVDRVEFPSDTWSTHFITAPGTSLLKRWGVLDPLLAKGVPLFDRVNLITPTMEMSSADLLGPAFVVSPRRTDLDLTLVEQAIAAGAEVRTNVTVTELMHDASGRVTGVTLRDAEGNMSEERGDRKGGGAGEGVG